MQFIQNIMSKDITIVTGQFPARSETFVTQHIMGLARLGWNVNVIASRIGESIETFELDSIDALGVKRHYIEFISGSFFQKLFKLFLVLIKEPKLLNFIYKDRVWSRFEILWSAQVSELINAINPQITHIHYGSKAAPLSLFKINSKIFVTWHGYDANIKPKVYGEDMYYPLFKRGLIHTVGSNFMMNRLQELGCLKKDLRKVPMGVDIDLFQYVDRSMRNNKTLKIISTGRLDEMKGHKYLIDALSILKARDILVNLKIIGDGPLYLSLKNQIKEKNLSANINLLGSQNSKVIIQELAASDLFVLAGVIADSGRVETQGVAIIEAQASGLPVIVTDVGGVSESLLPSKTGQLVPSRDARAIADAITKYINHKDLLINHGRAGNNYVKKYFSIQKMLKTFEEMYFDK